SICRTPAATPSGAARCGPGLRRAVPGRRGFPRGRFRVRQASSTAGRSARETLRPGAAGYCSAALPRRAAIRENRVPPSSRKRRSILRQTGGGCPNLGLMPATTREDLERALPRLRHDVEAARRLAERAVERAGQLAERAQATRRVLEDRARTAP